MFSRASKPKFWLWDLLSGGRGAKASRRRRITPKGVLHQIAAETPSLAAVPSADLALETIRRTLGIELPSSDREGPGDKKGGKGGAKAGGSAEAVAAPLTWELLEAAFEHVSEDAAGHEAMGLASRLDRGGMHNLALQVLGRVRALEGRGLEAGIRVPADVLKLGAAVKVMETSRASALSEANIRYFFMLSEYFCFVPGSSSHTQRIWWVHSAERVLPYVRNRCAEKLACGPSLSG